MARPGEAEYYASVSPLTQPQSLQDNMNAYFATQTGLPAGTDLSSMMLAFYQAQNASMIVDLDYQMYLYFFTKIAAGNGSLDDAAAAFFAAGGTSPGGSGFGAAGFGTAPFGT